MKFGNQFSLIFKKNKEFIIIALILTLAAIKVFGYVLMYQDISPNGAPEEFMIDYIAGKNFAIKGFGKLFFLADYSTDLQKDSPPVFATHTPSLVMIINGLMIKLGLNIFEMRMIYTAISLTGILFLFLFIAQIANLWSAVIASLLLIINYNGYLVWADHQLYAFWYAIFFGYLWARFAFPQKKYILAPLFILIASLFSHIIWGYLIAAEIIFYLFEKNRKILLLSFLFSAIGILSHLIPLFLALGWQTVWQDFFLTVSNRIFSYPPKEQLIAFYQAHHLALFGSSHFNDSSLWEYINNNILKPLWFFRIQLGWSIFILFLLAYFKMGYSYKNWKIILTIFLAGSFWHIFFPAMAQNYGIPFAYTAFLVVFFGLILGDLMEVIYNIFYKKIPFFEKTLELSILAVCLIIFSIYTITNHYFNRVGHLSGDKNLIQEGRLSEDKNLIREIETLRRYNGKTFFTNIFPTNVSFATGAWTIGSCPADGLVNLDPAECQSKFAVQSENLKPDYILLSYRYSPFPCYGDCFGQLKKRLEEKYDLVEEINGGISVIFKVIKK